MGEGRGGEGGGRGRRRWKEGVEEGSVLRDERWKEAKNELESQEQVETGTRTYKAADSNT